MYNCPNYLVHVLRGSQYLIIENMKLINRVIASFKKQMVCTKINFKLLRFCLHFFFELNKLKECSEKLSSFMNFFSYLSEKSTSTPLVSFKTTLNLISFLFLKSSLLKINC